MFSFYPNRITVLTSSFVVGAISLTTVHGAIAAQFPTSGQPGQSSSMLIATAYNTTTLPTLRRGNQGEAVRLLRDILISNGFLPAAMVRLGVTGSYQPAGSSFDYVVEDAIKDLQRRYNLTADGVVGPTTWEVLDQQENPYRGPLPWQQASNPVPVRPTPPSGMREAFVRVQQGTLNIRREPWGTIVNSLPNGARVLVTSNRQGDWVQLDNGNWLREQYIRYSGN
ncbi:peptidoglycan-binding domain-containing protein [Leptolyngbya ohadii]|uniref:peptidoglycan-binding domain-containing protein n=1 Tax=Leptolyngbya ohadii TaxID=1962290 RepID=UPI000B598DB7|nr:peptidoglycan-binding domain-containing protein [Leptolyngbya ohadii]